MGPYSKGSALPRTDTHHSDPFRENYGMSPGGEDRGPPEITRAAYVAKNRT